MSETLGTVAFDDVYLSDSEVRDLEVAGVEGAIPPELSGTLLRNGPGRTQVGADPLNFFDADGLLGALTFSRGKARLRTRPVETEHTAREAKAGRLVVRRPFTNRPGRLANLFRPTFATGASHDAFGWAGHLFATGEQAHARFDAATLTPRGAERWGAEEGELLCPMPRVDARTGRLVGYAVRPGKSKPDRVTFFEVDAAGQTVARAAFTFDRPATVIHDLAFTRGHYLVVELPMEVRIGRLLLGRTDVWNAFDWPTARRPRVHLVPRGGEGAPLSVELPGDARVIFHLVNAHEEGGAVILDVPGAATGPDFSAGAPPALRARDGIAVTRSPEGQLYRYRIDLAARRAEEVRRTPVSGEAPEVAPGRRGERARFGYVLSPGAGEGREPDPATVLWRHAIAKVDLETGEHSLWQAGPHRFCSPPAFAPRPGAEAEDDGWLLSWVMDAARRTTDVVVLDAREPGRGPVATIALGVRLPQVSHARFVADA